MSCIIMPRDFDGPSFHVLHFQSPRLAKATYYNLVVQSIADEIALNSTQFIFAVCTQLQWRNSHSGF